MVDSKVNAKKYFLPIYSAWALITPTIVSYMSGYLNAAEGQSAFDAIPWGRVLSFYALFGLIWPLTIVISPAFFVSVRELTGATFGDAITLGLTSKPFIAYFLFTIAWIGPLVSMILAIYYHKRNVALQTEDPDSFGWIDYLAAFV